MGDARRNIGGKRIASATFIASALAAGCAMPTDGAKGPAGPAGPVAAFEPAEAPAPGQTGGPESAGDLLAAHADDPFTRPASSVNVFGEVDGVGPSSPFSVAGKAGFQQRSYVDEGYDSDPDISPDGKWMIFGSTRHSEHPEIYLQRVDGLAVTQLTTEPGDDAFPRFSNDGRRICFASNRAGNWDIYVMDVDGKNVEPVTRGSAQEIHPSFSPDGKRIVYSALGSRSGQWELWTVDLASGERKMIGYGLFPDWCPRADRDVIAFQRARQRGTRWFSAWTLELIDGEAKHVTEVAFSTNAAIVAPSWSRDGRRLAFCTIGDPQAADAKANVAGGVTSKGATDIWTINLDGTDRKRITDGRGVNATPAWSPDGQVFFVTDRGGSEAIWSVATDRPRGTAAEATAQWPSYPDDANPPTTPAAHASARGSGSPSHATPADAVFGETTPHAGEAPPAAMTAVDSGNP